MKFLQHYSSSRGNLYEVVASCGKRLLIDCGVAWDKLCESVEHDFASIEGCLVSHGHADHSKSIEKLCEAGVEVYASTETLDGIESHRANIISDSFELESFTVVPFPTKHDCDGSLGFIVDDKSMRGDSLLFAVDTKEMPIVFRSMFTHIAIECSYDIQTLIDNASDDLDKEPLAKRLLDSHMERSVCLYYISKLDLSRLRELHLLHLSGTNIDKQETKELFEKAFFVKARIKGL